MKKLRVRRNLSVIGLMVGMLFMSQISYASENRDHDHTVVQRNNNQLNSIENFLYVQYVCGAAWATVGGAILYNVIEKKEPDSFSQACNTIIGISSFAGGLTVMWSASQKMTAIQIQQALQSPQRQSIYQAVPRIQPLVPVRNDTEIDVE